MSLPLRLMACLATVAAPAWADEAAPSIELRMHFDARGANSQGPLAAADMRAPGLASEGVNTWLTEVELRHTLHAKLADQPWSLAADLLAWGQRPQGQAATARARVNELHLGTELGAYSFSGGKKVVGWDVGYGFRPNDVVEQETRRSLLTLTPEGRPLVELEHFGSDSAATVVWANPQNLNANADDSRGARESALAWHGYQRAGAVDLHGFARLGRRTGASAGTAVAWVASDETELHASWRVMARHDAWTNGAGASPNVVATNPWQQATQGGTSQWLLGLTWTGEQQQSMMVEAWHDGTAPSNTQWTDWRVRNASLMRSLAPAPAVAGNLAWQATPLDGSSLRRDNLYLRAAWQPADWTLSLDGLYTPADHGQLITAGVQWQGNHWRINAAWRLYGGAPNAVYSQLPLRQTGVLAATRPY